MLSEIRVTYMIVKDFWSHERPPTNDHMVFNDFFNNCETIEKEK